MSPKIAIAIALIVVSASAVLAQPMYHAPPARVSDAPGFIGYVPDEFVVVFKPGVRSAIDITNTVDGKPVISLVSVQKIIEQTDVRRIRRQFPTAIDRPAGSPYPDLTGHYKITLESGADLDGTIAAFAANLDVDHVEKIGMHTVSTRPNDPYFVDSPDPAFDHDQWHLWDANGIQADTAWTGASADPSVVVGILDTGVRYYHWDIGGYTANWGPDNPYAAGNVFVNGAETPGDGIDNDGNGYTDDVIGWDFVSAAGDATVLCLDADCVGSDNNPDDGNGHGTHVAGVVSAITHNGWAVSGVAGGYGDGTVNGQANGAKILPLRIGFHAYYLGFITGIVRMDWAAEAMNYVADLVDAGTNVTAVNCSWSSSNSGGLDAAVDNLLAHDVMVVHAAGNENSSAPDFLGSKAGVMNVAATDRNGNGAGFSNHGPWVDVAAPGVQILSTSHVPYDPDPTHHYIGILDGTSVSVPQVVGIAALLESCNPALSGPAKFSLIVNNTATYNDTRDLGSGIANAWLALSAAGCGSTPVTGVDTPRFDPAPFSWAYPNPFNPATGIFFQLDATGDVEIIVYDVAGRVVRNLISQSFQAGTHRVVFDGLDDRGQTLSSGVYFYRISTGQRIQRSKIVLVR